MNAYLPRSLAGPGWRPAVAVVGLLLVTGLPPAFGSPSHSCSGCHDRVPSSGDSDGTFGKPDAAVCLRCHDSLLRGEASPGTRVVTRNQPWAYGHLQDRGQAYDAVTPGPSNRAFRLECTTCHSPHPNGRKHQLRVPTARASPRWSSPRPTTRRSSA